MINWKTLIQDTSKAQIKSLDGCRHNGMSELTTSDLIDVGYNIKHCLYEHCHIVDLLV